jgi:hypothetical protein
VAYGRGLESALASAGESGKAMESLWESESARGKAMGRESWDSR